MKVSDYQMLDILALARRDGALVMVHAENHDMIQWLAHHLVEQGHVAPKFHAIAHARVAEAEATNRAISLARLVDAPMLIVHMSEIEAIETLRQAQKKGLKIFGETCPQYIALTADDMDKPGVEGAMWCCSPPPRDSAAQEAVWAALKDGTFQTFSSDHAPYQFNERRQDPQGRQDHLQGDGQRRAGPRDPPAAAVLRGRAEGPHHPAAVRGADLDQPRQALRPLSAQGHDRRRLRCRLRDLGRRQGRDDPLEGPARQCRLHARTRAARSRAGRSPS